ncbi:hypothetical protein ACKXGF_14055 [Alkalibacillus sp. S2W]|uniref:hypothetical protein n=1 Tax=Alkalibacillus sp. S2W TaxID=3386553 RepID=UPI00398D29E1
MRLKPIKHLVQLYSTFFVRKILNFGVLKNPIIRVLLFIAFFLLMTVISLSVFMFFSEAVQTEEIVRFLLNTYSSTIILWTIVVTIFLKVIFSKVDSFLRMTINFPVSNKERNFSVFLYETFISFAVIFLLSFSVVLSMLLIHQLAFIDILVVNLLYVSTITYLGLQVVSRFVSFVCFHLHMQKLFHIINISILVLIFSVVFRKAQSLVTDLSNDLIQGTNETDSILLLFQLAHEEYGFLLTTIIYLSLVIVLLGMIIVIPDQSHMSNSKHILVFDFNTNSMLRSYVLSTVRNMNTLNTIALVYLAALIMILFNLSEYILYTTVILSFNSIYSFIHSQNLRKVLYRFNYLAWKDYLYLITSQLIIIYSVSLLLFVPGLITIQSMIHLIIPYVVVTFSVLIFVLAGILFPPYNDNPFSVITSIAVVTIPILVIGISLTFLNLDLWLNIGTLIFFYTVIVLFSVQGLNNMKRGFRNETFVHVY